MTATNQPNEHGFAGGATGPDPDAREHTDGEDFAIPADDLTGSLSDGIDELTHAGNARDDDPR